MTREEAKELLPIIQAFAKGKTIECKNLFGSWAEAKCPSWSNNFEYRIKPEPKYRPFKNQEECWQEMHKYPDFGWVKDKNTKNYYNITEIYEIRSGSAIVLIGDCAYTLNEAFDVFTFTDSTPFGIKDE